MVWAVIAVLIGASSVTAQAGGSQCKEIGGMALADAIDDTDLVAALSGELGGGARARITAQRETATGLVLDMEHYFINDKGGLLKTMDKATLTAVPGKIKTYMLEIAYEVVEARGTYAGYKGRFQSYGLINLAAGKVVLRYNGEICK
jgi:hypothetical protein